MLPHSNCSIRRIDVGRVFSKLSLRVSENSLIEIGLEFACPSSGLSGSVDFGVLQLGVSRAGILRVGVSPQTGEVVGWIDLEGLLKPEDRYRRIDVLNGIAYDANNDRLFVTGKLWPKLFEINWLRQKDKESGPKGPGFELPPEGAPILFPPYGSLLE